ncbi:hypothetical protein [Halioxenophilus aromaticivorans]|uniref:Uncharacterized protein n=1 Tax=Halioxenophilus aromaticivorans TaxID=1306992 RepID=A0AAV3U1Z1_9ALTE
MILQRLANAIRKQDWFTVVIETLIVVFGVYLGIQLGNWNTARNAKADEQRIIERLTLDFISQEKLVLDYIDMAQAMLADIDELATLLEMDQPPEDSNRVKRILVNMFGVSTKVAPPPSFDELVASGGFTQLSSIPLRHALAKYGQTNSLWVYVENRSAAVKEPQSPLVRALQYRPGYLGSGDEINSLIYDWEKLKQAKPDLLLVIINLVQALDRHQKDLAAVRNVLDALEREQ